MHDLHASASAPHWARHLTRPVLSAWQVQAGSVDTAELDDPVLGHQRRDVLGQVDHLAPLGLPFGRPGLRPDLLRSDLGAGLASPSPDGGLDEFRRFCPSLARSASISARSASTWARSTATSASLASITCRSRVLAARSAAVSAAGGTSRTNHRRSQPAQRNQHATPGRLAIT